MGSRLTRGGGGGAARSPREERPRSASVQGAAGWWPGLGGRDSALSALLLRPERLLSPKPAPAPYVRRVRWIREIQALLRQQRAEQAATLLGVLRKDLGLEGTSLNDVLYKHTAFLNLVDPISHDLLMNLARDIQCPKKELESLKSAEKLCRQLIYHLTPHAKWQRQAVTQHAQPCLNTALQRRIANDSLDLSGMPLAPRDVQRVACHLQLSRDHLISIDLSFTELTDGSLQFLLPFLAALPKLTNLALNGNRLTKVVLRDMTEMMKEPNVFPALSWVDLGNNADICSMPQPLLVGLRRRCSLQGALPTIQEHSESQASDQETEQGEASQSWQEDEGEVSQSQEEQGEVSQSLEEQGEVGQSRAEDQDHISQSQVMHQGEVSQSQKEGQGEFSREEKGEVSQSREEDQGEVSQSQDEEEVEFERTQEEVSQSREEEQGKVSQSKEEQGKISQSEEEELAEVTQSQEEGRIMMQCQEEKQGLISQAEPSRPRGEADSPWQGVQREAGTQQYCQR